MFPTPRRQYHRKESAIAQFSAVVATEPRASHISLKNGEIEIRGTLGKSPKYHHAICSIGMNRNKPTVLFSSYHTNTGAILEALNETEKGNRCHATLTETGSIRGRRPMVKTETALEV